MFIVQISSWVQQTVQLNIYHWNILFYGLIISQENSAHFQQLEEPVTTIWHVVFHQPPITVGHTEPACSECFSNRPIQIDNCYHMYYKCIALLSTRYVYPFEMFVSALDFVPNWFLQQYGGKACKVNFTHQRIQQLGELHKMYAVCIYVNPYFQCRAGHVNQ